MRKNIRKKDDRVGRFQKGKYTRFTYHIFGVDNRTKTYKDVMKTDNKLTRHVDEPEKRLVARRSGDNLNEVTNNMSKTFTKRTKKNVETLKDDIILTNQGMYF